MNARTPAPRSSVKLYRTALSGHCHRVEVFLSLLGLPCQLIEVDLRARAHKAPEFVAKNPFGQVPVIEDGEVTLADSNAILVYLEARYAPGQWLPREPIAAAQVQRWLSVATTRAFLAGHGPTLADIANYSYVARAPEGKVSLEPYPKLRAWLARIEALPGFIPMVKSPVGLAA